MVAIAKNKRFAKIHLKIISSEIHCWAQTLLEWR
jgi:hypothetical protein